MQIIVGTSVSGILFVAAAQITSAMLKVKFRNEATMTLSLIKTEFREILIFPTSWYNTIAAPINLDSSAFFEPCMGPDNSDDVDCQNRKGLLTIFDTINGVFYSHLNPTRGFDLNGGTCNNFKIIGNELNCPYRVEVYWRTACADTTVPCLIPTRYVAIFFIVDYGVDRMNSQMAQRYSFTFDVATWEDADVWLDRASDDLNPLDFVIIK